MGYKTIEEMLEAKVKSFPGGMSEEQKKIYQAYLERVERENADRGFIRGYDDGEPQTTVDFNHYENQDGKEREY